VTARDLSELLERTRLRADSVLARLADTEFQEGLSRMRADLSPGAHTGPIVEEVDLAVFTKSP